MIAVGFNLSLSCEEISVLWPKHSHHYHLMDKSRGTQWGLFLWRSHKHQCYWLQPLRLKTKQQNFPYPCMLSMATQKNQVLFLEKSNQPVRVHVSLNRSFFLRCNFVWTLNYKLSENITAFLGNFSYKILSLGSSAVLKYKTATLAAKAATDILIKRCELERMKKPNAASGEAWISHTCTNIHTKWSSAGECDSHFAASNPLKPLKQQVINPLSVRLNPKTKHFWSSH